MVTKLLGSLVLAAMTAGLVLADEPGGDVRWYVIATETGAIVGRAYHETQQLPAGTRVIDDQEIDVEEEGTPSEPLSWSTAPQIKQMSWRTVRTVDTKGRTSSISTDSEVEREWRRSTVHIVDNRVDVVRQTPTDTLSTSIPIAPDVRFDLGDGLLKGWNPATQPPLQFLNFNSDALAIERVRIAALLGARPDTHGRIALLRERFDGDQLVGLARLLIDEQHRIVEMSQPMFGVGLKIIASDRETALATHLALRPLTSAMVKSPFRISAAAMQGHIRYRFSFRDGVEFPLPETGEQRVSAEAGNVTVDICDSCGPGLSGAKSDLKDALKPTAWLQSADVRLKEIANPIAKLPVTDSRKMELLIEKAQRYIRHVDFTGHYSALETLSRRSADCTDAAVLLAALGRAAGIPTRVVNGLVYSRPSYHGVSNVFMPHSWTLAWADGKWRSFDLALDKFDSTHIALTVGDGDERSVVAANQLSALLNWNGMTEVRPLSPN